MALRPAVDEAVEQVEGGLLVGGPAEDIAAEDQRRDFEVGSSEAAFLQGEFSGVGRLRWRRRPLLANHVNGREQRQPRRPACGPAHEPADFLQPVVADAQRLQVLDAC